MSIRISALANKTFSFFGFSFKAVSARFRRMWYLAGISGFGLGFFSLGFSDG